MVDIQFSLESTAFIAFQALVVHLVKDNLSAVTLAIGDGANDVSMIKGTTEEVQLACLRKSV